jgi:polyphosphate glucokinase
MATALRTAKAVAKAPYKTVARAKPKAPAKPVAAKPKPEAPPLAAKPAPGPETLAFDIGGTRLKAALLDSAGSLIGTQVRVDTPHPSGPDVVLPLLLGLAEQLPGFDRISIGFPGVVKSGVVMTAPNLGTDLWHGNALAAVLSEKLGKPARMLNDGSVQGLSVIAGKGIEVVITLGTGFGFALFQNGALAPHLEMGQFPVRAGKTYDQYVGIKALQEMGRKRWNKRVQKVIAYLRALTNFDMLYIGGGNAKQITFTVPEGVQLVDNQAGLLGGVKLWALPEEAFAG